MPPEGAIAIPRSSTITGTTRRPRVSLSSSGIASGWASTSISRHPTPRAASGGPLARVRTGDRIRLSVSERRLDLLVDPAELARREVPASPPAERGYARLYQREILQADHGCDFNFLRRAPLGR